MLDCCVCCENPAQLGCVHGCELPTVTAAASGVYKLRGTFKNMIFEVLQETTAGALVVFDISTLNEYYKYTAEIIGPSGAVVEVDGAPCFCFDRRPKIA